MTTATAIAMTEAETGRPAAPLPDPAEALLSPAALQRLFAWLSPSFPVGGFSYSHGLEWAIEDGTVTAPAALEAWILQVLRHGAGWTDAVLFAHAWHAARSEDLTALRELGELAAAFQPSRERHLEATAQGRAFLATVAAAWPSETFGGRAAVFGADFPPTYAVAVAVAAACHGVPLPEALLAFLGAFAANLVSAGVRAIPIGQTDGQRIVAALAPVAEAVAADALATPLSELGGVALRADIASMKHETQYTRLFRS
jgi:urease accessory protein